MEQCFLGRSPDCSTIRFLAAIGHHAFASPPSLETSHIPARCAIRPSLTLIQSFDYIV
ncbi:MAG: hypothetical protein II110_07150 [Treponema sp.]|nr:hypothetical protein [Treponema sp.]